MMTEQHRIYLDQQFFASLMRADVTSLTQLLADDFTLVDIMSGSEVDKPAFLTAVGSGHVKFETIEPAEQLVRLYPPTIVITGRTQLKGTFGGHPFAVESRYTHVYVNQNGEWRLVAAQGTKISPMPEAKRETAPVTI
jgi:ketosteroid isomerase-like protein